ncbi:dual specificity protein phosphatase CDC14C [Anopheles cruzii]|uniref:dual specificity protein phosphatase CDC14C n=1 Tax=Anopheles cruzii TaxID=68878 RepID=UPI0022EC2227|nr:dual specificity protein phosphatase CDC14C [Anopheles cruzii]
MDFIMGQEELVKDVDNTPPIESDEDDMYGCLFRSVACVMKRRRLYFAVLHQKDSIPHLKNCCMFSTDNVLYEKFFDDFGPVHLSAVYRYCKSLNEMLDERDVGYYRILHYTSPETPKLLNAAFLMGSYAIIYLQHTAESILRTLHIQSNRLGKFCDASQHGPSYLISLYDCLSAIEKAHSKGFFYFADFDAYAYEYYERVENGDLNWIVPGKLLAFCGPHKDSRVENGVQLHGPEKYIEYFHLNNVTAVVRLNMKKYDAKKFTAERINHCELYFVDGGVPTNMILRRFLSFCEMEKGAIAVHCKAGLGRTGTLIGAYIIKHFSFSALEAIAWLRICRPGSVIGQQQTWLQHSESFLFAEGKAYRQMHPSANRRRLPYGIYSIKKNANPWNADALVCTEGSHSTRDHVGVIFPKNDVLQCTDTTGATNNRINNNVLVNDDSWQTVVDADDPMQNVVVENIGHESGLPTQGDQLNKIKANHRRNAQQR